MISLSDELDLDPATLHHIEFEAATSNDIVLSESLAAVTKALIRKTEALIVDLQSQLEFEKSRLERLKIAAAPHKKMPHELLCRIFKHSSECYYPVANTPGLGKPSKLCYYPHRNAQLVPWVLRQISSSWRRIAISQKYLWNNMLFGVSRGLSSKDTPRFVEFWAQNIGDTTYPIDIGIHDVYSFDMVHETVMVPFKELITTLDITANMSFFGLTQEAFPSLRTLELSFVTQRGRTGPLYDAFVEAPCFLGMKSLRSFTLRDSYFGLSNLPHTVPWNQLISISLISNLPVVSEILQHCVNSRFLSVRIGGMPWPMIEADVDLTTRIHLPHLNSLVYEVVGSVRHDNASPVTLLQYLSAPCLETLHLQMDEEQHEIDTNTPATLIDVVVERSKCLLRTLAITPIDRRWRSELHLQGLYSLTHLDAEYVLFSSPTVQQIVTGALIPSITWLSLAVNGLRDIELLTEFVERRSTSRSMERVKVQMWRNESTRLECENLFKGFLKRVRECNGSMGLKNAHVQIYMDSNLVN